MIDEIIQWLTALIETVGYPGVALSMFIESFFAPIPSEFILPFAGFLASEGKMNPIILSVIGGTFGYMGTLPFYFIGRVGNRDNVNKFVKKWGKFLFIQKDEVDKAFELFDRFGTPLIFFGRLIPLVRSFISFPAGMVKMNLTKFSLYTIAGSTLWSAILVTAGYFLGSNYEVVMDIVGKYERVIILIAIIAILAFLWYKITSFIRAKRKGKEV
jgi:membrane protein DedA with SNARE-associated domain